MKILIVNDQFERGGAGRVAAVLCNELYKRGYDITIATDTKHWHNTYYLDPSIPIVQIDSKTSGNKIKRWLSCSKVIRKYIKENNPNLIIATQSLMYLVTWIANWGISVPVIAADHTSFNRKIHPVIDFIRYHLYSRADGLTILTQKDERLLGDKFPRKRVIYNPLSFPILTEETIRKNTILCAGRLESWDIKGFDIILDIWKKLESKHPNWTLEIAGAGNGNSQAFVENMIKERGLDKRVNLLGHIDDMKKLYSESSIFALSSRMEGFPMVLMEAMSQGCACVAFSVGGASDEMMSDKSGSIIRDNDCESFGNALEALMSNEDLRVQCSHNAVKESSRFSVDSFVDNWIDYINSTLSLK